MANPVYPAHQTRVNMLAAVAAFPGETPLVAAACPQLTQTADIFQVQDGAANVLFSINSAGALSKVALAALANLGVPQVAYARYNYAVDGGAISTITPAVNTVIPANAIVIGGLINPTTALVGATATIGIGTSAGSTAASIKAAATAVTVYSVDALVATIPVFTAGSAFKMSAAGSITLTVAVAALTAGIVEVWLVYFVSNAA